MGPAEPDAAPREPAAASRGDDTGIDVEVVFSPAARVVETVPLRLPAGSTLADALVAVAGRLPPGAQAWMTGVWGRRAAPGQVLASGDRVELYRPLKIDPKEARRLRQHHHRDALDRQRKLRAGRSS